MKLQDFLKDLFAQPEVEGYEIGRVEIDVSISDDNLIYSVGGDNPCAKVVIVPKEKLLEGPISQLFSGKPQENK